MLNHRPHDCLHNLLFRRRSKKTSKLRVTGLWAGNSPATGEFRAQRVSKAGNVSIWWRHHVTEDISRDSTALQELKSPSWDLKKLSRRQASALEYFVCSFRPLIIVYAHKLAFGRDNLNLTRNDIYGLFHNPYSAFFFVNKDWYGVHAFTLKPHESLCTWLTLVASNTHNDVSNHRQIEYLFNNLSSWRPKMQKRIKQSKLDITGLYEGNPAATIWPIQVCPQAGKLVNRVF